MHKALLGTGAGLMAVSLLTALLLTAIDPLSAAEHVTLYSVWAWAQQAALVLGAALIAAGLVVVRLAPPTPPRSSASADVPVNWFAQ